MALLELFEQYWIAFKVCMLITFYQRFNTFAIEFCCGSLLLFFIGGVGLI